MDDYNDWGSNGSDSPINIPDAPIIPTVQADGQGTTAQSNAVLDPITPGLSLLASLGSGNPMSSGTEDGYVGGQEIPGQVPVTPAGPTDFIKDVLAYISNKDHAAVVQLGGNLVAGMMGQKYKQGTMEAQKKTADAVALNAQTNATALQQKLANASAIGKTNFGTVAGKPAYQNILGQRKTGLMGA